MDDLAPTGGQESKLQEITIKGCQGMPYSLQLQLHVLGCIQLLSETTEGELCPDPMNLLVSQLLLPQSLLESHFLAEALSAAGTEGRPSRAQLSEGGMLRGIKAGVQLQRDLALKVRSCLQDGFSASYADHGSRVCIF